jgi:SelR domain
MQTNSTPSQHCRLRVVRAGPPAFADHARHRRHMPSRESGSGRLLTPAQYQVLRHEATEATGSSPLLYERRNGVFVCAACELALFKSETKFDSGTGWPSFWSPIEGAVSTKTDRSFWMERTEGAAADILAMSLKTARRRPACAIA